jgi:hypothetical protein
MSAYSETFPWPSNYGHYDFFEARMKQHGKVVSLKAHGGELYDLTRTQGDTLRVFICECYAFGVAEYMEVVKNWGCPQIVLVRYARQTTFAISTAMSASEREHGRIAARSSEKEIPI